MKEADFTEWVRYADEDCNSAKALLDSDAYPGHVIFHCHDALEKYLKAIMLKDNQEIEYIHKLKNILINTPISDDDKMYLKNTFIILDELYMASRYPTKVGKVTKEDGKRAFERTRESVIILKKYL